MTKRTAAAIRKEEILEAALAIATVSGLPAVSGKKIAIKMGVSRQAVMYHITDMAALRRSVMQAAVDRKVLSVIAQGLASGCPIARAAPDELRQRAADGLV